MKIKSLVGLIILVFSLVFLNLQVQPAGASQDQNGHEEVCFCHNVNHNPHTICTDNQGHINGHTSHVNNGTDTFGECPEEEEHHFACVEDACVLVEGEGHDSCEEDEDCQEETPTPTPTPTEEVTPTPTPTQTPNVGGPGDGLSDGRSDGLSSCPSCTQAPQGQVLGASTGPQVLGLSTTSSGSNSFLNLFQLLGAFALSLSGFAFFKKNA